MAVDIVMPQMGESIFEGTITKWLKKPGDKVERDEPLFEISTDKVDAEIPSPSAGVLKEIKVGEGKTVPIQTVVGVIDAAGGAAQAAAPAPAPAQRLPNRRRLRLLLRNKPPSLPRLRRHLQRLPAKPAPAPAAQAAPAREGARIHSSPLVRRMAKEHGVDLPTVQGTGTGGRISKQDYRSASRRRRALPTKPRSRPSQPRPTFTRSSRSRSRHRRTRSSSAATTSAAAPGATAGSAASQHHGRAASRRVRDRRAARAHVLRQLRSAADDHHAPAHRRAHDRVEARFAARLQRR